VIKVVDQYERPRLNLGQAIAIWLAALCVFLAIKEVATFGFALLAYLGIGIALSRVVLHGLFRWHWLSNDVASITSSKLTLIATWPVMYPVLFFQYFVANYL
jgi:hypothetical protein